MTSDLWGGQSTEDNLCTGLTTSQKNMESILVNTLLPGGRAITDSERGGCHYGGPSWERVFYQSRLYEFIDPACRRD